MEISGWASNVARACLVPQVVKNLPAMQSNWGNGGHIPKELTGSQMQNWCNLVIQQLPHHPDSREVAPWRGFPAPCSRGERSSCCAASYVSGQMHLCLSCSEFTGWPRFP